MTKIHPFPKKRNISIGYDVASATILNNNRQKKLRRLPHIFAKVLELPICSTADVSVHESPNSFRFVVAADADEIGNVVRAQTVEICPGVVKIVVCGDVMVDELDVDVWRFRLTDCCRPEMATAACVDGFLVVVVPKGGDVVDGGGGGGGNWSRDVDSRLVVVQ